MPVAEGNLISYLYLQRWLFSWFVVDIVWLIDNSVLFRSHGSTEKAEKKNAWLKQLRKKICKESIPKINHAQDSLTEKNMYMKKTQLSQGESVKSPAPPTKLPKKQLAPGSHWKSAVANLIGWLGVEVRQPFHLSIQMCLNMLANWHRHHGITVDFRPLSGARASLLIFRTFSQTLSGSESKPIWPTLPTDPASRICLPGLGSN